MKQNVLSFDVLERNIRRIWQTLFRIAVASAVRNVFENAVFQTIAKIANAGMIVVFLRELARGAETDDVRNGGSPRAPALLLRAADNKRRQRNSFADVERADTLRRVQFVTRQCKQ